MFSSVCSLFQCVVLFYYFLIISNHVSNHYLLIVQGSFVISITVINDTYSLFNCRSLQQQSVREAPLQLLENRKYFREKAVDRIKRLIPPKINNLSFFHDHFVNNVCWFSSSCFKYFLQYKHADTHARKNNKHACSPTWLHAHAHTHTRLVPSVDLQ